MTTRLLDALGIRHLPLPVPFDIGHVNAYAIDEADGGIALVDTGAFEPSAERHLAGALRRVGRGFEDVRRVIVTHAHPDHFGAARLLVERARRDVPVLAHPLDAGRIREAGPRWAERLRPRHAFLVAHGLPPAAVPEYAASADLGRWEQRLPATADVEDGDVLRFGRFEARVLHLPGHTAGHLNLVDDEHGVLFTGDHLVEAGSSFGDPDVPADGAGPFRPIATYLGSLLRTRELELQIVLPGHGAPFGDHRRAVDRFLERLRERDARIEERLRGTSRTAYELTEALYPSLAGAGLPKRVRAMLQLLAHLHAIEERGEIVRRTRGGIHRFEVVSGANGAR